MNIKYPMKYEIHYSVLERRFKMEYPNGMEEMNIEKGHSAKEAFFIYIETGHLLPSCQPLQLKFMLSNYKKCQLE